MFSSVLRPRIATVGIAGTSLLATAVGVACLPPRAGFQPLQAGDYLSSLFQRHTLRCDGPSMIQSYQSEARVPVVEKTSGGGFRLNSRAVRQISIGSITGLVGGLAVGIFSKSLAFLIGMLVLGVQTLESRGIPVIPRARLQRYLTDLDVKSLMLDNVAFKLSFGLAFAMAGFTEF